MSVPSPRSGDTSSAERRPHVARSEVGTGLIGTIVGFLVVLVLVLGACELLVGLHAQTTVTGVVADAARSVATGQRTPEQAEADARRLLGAAGDDASLRWMLDADQVRLRVQIARPDLTGRFGLDRLLGPIDRTVVVRREALR
jgi:hypothetical protein